MNRKRAAGWGGHPEVVLFMVLSCALAFSGTGCRLLEPAAPPTPRNVTPPEDLSSQDVKLPEAPLLQGAELPPLLLPEDMRPPVVVPDDEVVPPPEPPPVAKVTPPAPPAPPVVVQVKPAPHDEAAAKELHDLLTQASEKLKTAKDFHCLLHRVEVVDGELRPAEELDFTQRFQPHSLKLEWVGERFKGRKVIYVAGANDGKVLVQSGGLSGKITGWIKKTLRFDLTSPIIKSQGRYPLDVAGYDALVERLVQIRDDADKAGQLRVQGLPPIERDGGKLRQFEVVLEGVPREAEVSKMTFWFDLESSLPVHTILYDGGGRLVEDYDWRNVKLDAGLTDADFTFGNE